MLTLFNNEKFRKFIRIFLIVANVTYLVAPTLVILSILTMFVIYEGPAIIPTFFRGMFPFPLWVSFVAYAFALRSYGKKEFVRRATVISLGMMLCVLLIYIMINFKLFRLPFDGIIVIGSVYNFAASMFWGEIGLFLPKRWFLASEPTKKTFIFRKIFYGLLLLTYVVCFYYEYFILHTVFK